MTNFTRAAATALLFSGCAGGQAARDELAGLREEIRSIRHENEELSRHVDALQGRVDVLSARASHQAEHGRVAEPARAAGEPAALPAAAALSPPTVIPSDLAVVKMRPGRPAARAAPPVPTSVPLVDPGPAALDALASPGRRGLAAEADAQLAAARARADDLARAHALEDFAGRYPRHPAADNALVEAAGAYDAGGRADAACALAARVQAEYPAGDALGDALERLARCEAVRGQPDAERRLLERVAREHPGTPAAARAGTRLATISGHADEPSAPRPARSAP